MKRLDAILKTRTTGSMEKTTAIKIARVAHRPALKRLSFPHTARSYEFLSDLRRLDVKLWADGDDLCYRANKETLTPTLRQELKERKVEILTFLRNANAAASSNSPPILPAPRDRNLPLSFAQTRLWFLDRLEPHSSTYNMPVAYHLTGVLNTAALEQSLNEILQRHEVLRTTFPTVDGQPSQAIAPSTA